MKTVSPIVRLRNALQAACGAIGMGDEEIFADRTGVDVPGEGISLAITLSEGHRVWRAVETYTIRSVGEAEDRQFSTILFEEPVGSELWVAKRIAMKVAEGRVDTAIDRVAS